MFEYLIKHKDISSSAYICHMYNDDVNIMIHCFELKQTRYFQKQSCLQLDMTFKQIVEDINKIAFAIMKKQIEQDK